MGGNNCSRACQRRVKAKVARVAAISSSLLGLHLLQCCQNQSALFLNPAGVGSLHLLLCSRLSNSFSCQQGGE